MSDDVVFKDFTKKRKEVRFTVGEESFEVLPSLPIPVMQEFLSIAKKIEGKSVGPETLTDVMHIFDLVLKGDSASRFAARIASLDDDNIGLDQAMDIIQWMMEHYSKRPTVQPANSSASSPGENVGTISTAGVSSVA